MGGTSNMIPGYLPPPPMPPLSENDLDVDIGYKSLPPLPTFNGKSEFGGLDGSTCGSDQDYKFDTCEHQARRRILQGKGRLEICSNGYGSFISLDIHHCRLSRICRHHTSSTCSL